MKLPAHSSWHKIGEPYTRGHTREEDGKLVYTDFDFGAERIVVLELSREGLEWLAAELPDIDSFTKDMWVLLDTLDQNEEENVDL